MAFNFRIRFDVGPHDRVGYDTDASVLPAPNEGVTVELKAIEQGKSIRKARKLVIRGEEWNSEEAALECGARVKAAALLAFAAVRVGVSLGERKKGGFFTAGLKMLEEQFGGRVLDDTHGLVAFEAEPTPKFGAMEAVGFKRTVAPERFVEALRRAYQLAYVPSDAETLSFELYNASFFERTARTRFLVLVMAIEALLEPGDRRAEAREHVEYLLRLTRESATLTPQEAASIEGSLRWVLRESISHTGRQLAAQRLGQRSYMNLSPERFFVHCYSLRSTMIHGRGLRGDEAIIGSTAAALEVFVADLIAGYRLGFLDS